MPISSDINPRAAEVARELTRRRADLVGHARGSLEQHLLGVHTLLVRWQQPERVCLAGLLHSAYSTESFEHRLFPRAERARVRELIGADAERLVFAFCASPRDALLAAAEARKMVVSIPTRWKDVAIGLDARDVADLLIIHAANLAEQTCGKDGAPAPWIATATRYLVAARAHAEVPAPVPVGNMPLVTLAEERAQLRNYRGSLRAAIPGRGARDHVVEPELVGEPLIVKGIWALAAGMADQASSYGVCALIELDAWGVAWDKRLRYERWRQLAGLLVESGRLRGGDLDAAALRVRAAIETADGSPARLWATLDAVGAFARPAPPRPLRAPRVDDDDDGLPPRFAQYIGGLRTNAERPMMEFYPGLTTTPWHDPKAFPIVADLERLAPQIAEEAKAFDAERFQDEAENIGREGRWGVAFLLEMGRRNEKNLARCPSLRWILEHHRTLTTHAGLMYFSCLDPHSSVEAHHGPTNVRLRCHLGLDVPEGCGIRVGEVPGTWQNGRCIVFDDSFAHEVWNDSDRGGIVLVLDLWHPDLSEDEVALLAGLHRYGLANESGTKKALARNDAALRRAEAAAAKPEDVRVLDEEVTAALRNGDLVRAGQRAARYAALCRGTRWYPVRSERDPELPRSVPWPRVLTPSKLLHDIEQLDYLKKRGIVDLSPVVDEYERLLDTLRPLGDEARVPLVGVALDAVGHVYNRLVHVRDTPRVERALSPTWNRVAIEKEFHARQPSAVVIDDFLSPDALASLRLFCLESTVWSTNRYDYGRLGAFFRDGFNCPLLIQIAEELRDALPRIIDRKRHPVTQLWGYKYASTQPCLSPHADFAAVNVNFWITPDDANLEKDSGGLLLYDVAAPKEWDFPKYNRNAAEIRALLAKKKAKPTVIPYRCNRAVIFDSDLFHTTPALSFRSGYENRRVNVTVLFGNREDRPARRVSPKRRPARS
jgi:hypothetical protein